MGRKTSNSKLYKAIRNGNLHCVKKLICTGNVNKLINKQTCLFMAAAFGHIHLVQYINEQGAEIDKINDDGETALFVGSQHGHLQIVQYLLDQNADVHASGNGMTALHAAVKHGFVDVANCLMQRGMADLSARDYLGRLPMDLARTEAMRDAIYDEKVRRTNNHGFKRVPEEALQEVVVKPVVEEDDNESSEEEN